MTRDLIVGFVAGVVAGAVGYRYYQKNQSTINAFLSGRGIGLASGASGETSSIDELVSQKERLEDLIAEHEAAAKA